MSISKTQLYEVLDVGIFDPSVNIAFGLYHMTS